MKTCFAMWTILTFGVTLAHAAGQPKIPPTQPSFAVTITGTGRPVILIPGLDSSGAVWDGTVARLKDRYRCHVLTLAGFAGQPAIPGPFLETVRNDLASYIRDQKLDHPIIIGHSLGGFLALWLASENTDLVGPLVIVDSLPFLPAAFNPDATIETMKPMAEQMRAGMAAGGPQFLAQSEAAVKTMVTKPENVALVMSWTKATDPASAGNGMYDLFTHDLRREVQNIQVPILVLGTWIAYRESTTETTTRAAVDKTFQSQYAQVKHHKVVLSDNARHFIMLDDPDWFYAQIEVFLSTTTPEH
jgi:N-formylmaleamate deformylase